MSIEPINATPATRATTPAAGGAGTARPAACARVRRTDWPAAAPQAARRSKHQVSAVGGRWIRNWAISCLRGGSWQGLRFTAHQLGRTQAWLHNYGAFCVEIAQARCRTPGRLRPASGESGVDRSWLAHWSQLASAYPGRTARPAVAPDTTFARGPYRPWRQDERRRLTADLAPAPGAATICSRGTEPTHKRDKPVVLGAVRPDALKPRRRDLVEALRLRSLNELVANAAGIQLERMRFAPLALAEARRTYKLVPTCPRSQGRFRTARSLGGSRRYAVLVGRLFPDNHEHSATHHNLRGSSAVIFDDLPGARRTLFSLQPRRHPQTEAGMRFANRACWGTRAAPSSTGTYTDGGSGGDNKAIRRCALSSSCAIGG